MPMYEYRCEDCQEVSTVLVYPWSKGDPACKHCGGFHLTKLLSKFTQHRSWGSSLNFPSSEDRSSMGADSGHSHPHPHGHSHDHGHSH
ncbi:MAG: zinc ribbon domain-containing protein [SAR202 cluster bacterium]|nr:zinc ribbon domain-containing protein [SAR202 cluster bacterium]